uniref:Ig-like domain-containing protein n=1 Tax=Pedobacter sp. TaxID=1411316 RepID=UPI003D7F5B47
DVFAQGAGRVQPLKAVTTEALAYSLDTTIFSNQTYENTKGSVTFGNVTPNSTNSTSITKNILVENLTGKASDYSVSVQVTKAATGTLAGSTVTVNKSNFTLDASGESELEVTLNVPAGTGSVGNEILGYIHLTNGTTKLTLPFAANFGPPTGLKSYTIDNPAISPNGDGVLDSTTVRYEFHNLQYYTYVELWDALNQDAGYYGDGYVGYLRQTTSTTTGPKTVAFDGSYTSYNPGVGRVKAPDGVYTIDLSTLNSSNTAYATQNYVGPIYVKTTAPQIVSEEALTTGTSSVELSGAIEDSYIDWKAAVAAVFEEDYDVNTKLTTAYVLTNSNNEIQEGTTPIILNQDGTFSATINGLTAGENKVKITVTDEAGNHADKEIIVNYDKPAPAPTPIVSGVEDGGFYNHNVTISFTEGTAKLNGKKFKNNTVVKAEGKYTLEVTDSANKKIIINFTIDKTAPKVTGVKNNGLYNTNVTISFNEGSAQLNGEPLANKSVISKEGQYTLVVTDAAGNATTVNFTINKTAPAAPTVNEVSDIDTKISGKTEAGATVKLYISNKSQGSVTADKSGNFSFKIKKQSAGTEIKVTATNKVGNTSEATTVIVIDKTAPETPSVDKVNTSSTKITGKAEAGATVTAKVGNTAIGTATADQKGKFSINISKQKSGTVITITATDVAGNTSSAKTVTVGK